MLIPFVISTITCTKRLRRKFHSDEPTETPFYEHSIELGKKRKLSDVFAEVLLLLFFILFALWILPAVRDEPDFWLFAASLFLMIVSGFLHLYRSLCSPRNYDLKITTALYKQKLNISWPDEGFLSDYAAFPLDEITEARIATAEDPEILEHVIFSDGKLLIRTNAKIKSGPYMYAFFLSNSFPLPDGHQAVDLKLRNGRHVLIETDDAENFLAALKNARGMTS
jgi:hypothetical protein